MDVPVESESTTTAAAFFDLDKTIISRSSTLAFAPSFYRYGLITRTEALRGACAQLAFRMGGAGQRRMDRVRTQLSELCRDWSAEQVGEIVSRHLTEIIVPHVYAEARDLMAAHAAAGREVIIVSTSGQEMVRPIAALLGASRVIATRMEVSDGRYTGGIEFYAYGEAKAREVSNLAAAHGYQLPACFAYSDSVTDLPLLELVGHPHVVNPDRALRRIALARGWPVLSFSGTPQATPRTRPAGRGQQGRRSGERDTGE